MRNRGNCLLASVPDDSEAENSRFMDSGAGTMLTELAASAMIGCHISRFAAMVAAKIGLDQTLPLNNALRAKLPALILNGMLVTKLWLMEQGIARHTIDNLVKSGQLFALRHGVYMRHGSRFVWQGVVSSLHRMGSSLVAGEMTALELHGWVHYLCLSQQRTIHLHALEPLPSWTGRLGLAETFRRHGTAWLSEQEGAGRDGDGIPVLPFTVDIPWGDGFRTVRISTLERALFEILEDFPAGVSFEHSEQLMEGLTGLLGRGKRVVARTGRLVSRYGITVPGTMHGQT